MMIISTGKSGGGARLGSWHTGETMHIPQGTVLTFQVDCHEASWLLNAISAALAADGLEMVYPSLRLTPIL